MHIHIQVVVKVSNAEVSGYIYVRCPPVSGQRGTCITPRGGSDAAPRTLAAPKDQ